MNTTEIPAVVFDCMIYLQSLIKEKSPAIDCLDLFERGKVKLLVSQEILEKIADVLTRPKLQAKYSLLTKERADKLVEILKEKAILIKNVPPRFAYPRDLKDEKYINLAIEAEAEYIVSRDSDLLDLMTDKSEEAKEFRQRFRPLRVITPPAFLEMIRKTESEEHGGR